jgi:hypothetical protein
MGEENIGDCQPEGTREDEDLPLGKYGENDGELKERREGAQPFEAEGEMPEADT